MPFSYPLPCGQTRTYEVSLEDLSTSTFYPCIFSLNKRGDVYFRRLTAEVAIRSAGYSGAEPWNSNQIKFEANTPGWSDAQPRWMLLHAYGAYDYGEKTIGCVGGGDKDGYLCVWLRGGIKYYVTTNCIPTVYEAGITSSNGDSFMPGPNLYGGTNTSVSTLFTPGNAAVFLHKYPE